MTDEKISGRKKGKIHFSASSLIKNNRFIFIISLIAAISLWVTVSPNRETKIGVSVNIDTANTSAETLGLKVVSGNAQHIDVTVSGKWYVLSELDDKDIKINYSLGEVTKPGEYELSLSALKVTNNSDYEIVRVNPDKISVSFDYIYTRSFKIESKAPNIKAKDGYILDVPVIDSSNSIIDITGPKSIIEKIDKVEANVSENDTLDRPKSYTVPLKILNAAGDEMSTDGLTLPFKEVGVTVPISKSKTVPVKVEFKNAPTYYEKHPLEMDLSVDKLNVVGSPEVISTLDSVTLGTIDFSTLDPAHDTYTFDLKLPSGVKSVDDVKQISCKLAMGGYTKKSVDVSSFTTVNNPSGAKITISNQTKTVIVAGPKADIEALSASDLYYECDMNSYSDNKGEFMADAVLKSRKSDKIWDVGKNQIQLKVE